MKVEKAEHEAELEAKRGEHAKARIVKAVPKLVKKADLVEEKAEVASEPEVKTTSDGKR